MTEGTMYETILAAAAVVYGVVVIIAIPYYIRIRLRNDS